MKPLLPACLLLAFGATGATVTGHLASPAGVLPALHVYAWSSAGRLVATATAPGQSAFRLELPPGQYRFFATPADPGVPLVYAGHTGCGSAEDGGPACSHHELRPVMVAGDGPTHVEIDDWRIDDAQAQQLDRALHHPQGAGDADPASGAPRFFEYPAEPLRRAHATVLAAGAGTPGERAPLLEALQAGHINFAGRATVVHIPCGGNCTAARIIDLATGRVTAVPSAPVGTGLPACTEHYAYRRDSRLLRVGFDDGEGEPGDAYYLWDPESAQLHPLGTPPAGRCAPRAGAER